MIGCARCASAQTAQTEPVPPPRVGATCEAMSVPARVVGYGQQRESRAVIVHPSVGGLRWNHVKPALLPWLCNISWHVQTYEDGESAFVNTKRAQACNIDTLACNHGASNRLGDTPPHVGHVCFCGGYGDKRSMNAKQDAKNVDSTHKNNKAAWSGWEMLFWLVNGLLRRRQRLEYAMCVGGRKPVFR